MRRVLPGAVVLAVVVALPAGSSVRRAVSFSVGVMRADGILIPFAHFDGRRWQNEWPVPPRRVDVPIGLDDIPSDWWPDRTPELAWNLWTFDGEARRIDVKAPLLIPVYCGTLVGLRTSWASDVPPPPWTEQPYPKIGLATSGDVVVEPITVVPDSEEWRLLEEALVWPFEEAETHAIGQEFAFGWGFPVRSEDRRGKPVTLEAVYRAPHERPGSVVHFFEATRRYDQRRSRDAPQCDLVTFASGWSMSGPGVERTLNLVAGITDCDRWDVNVMYPLGLIRLDGQVLWVAQWSGWEEEVYAVVDVPADLETHTLIQTGVGDCR